MTNGTSSESYVYDALGRRVSRGLGYGKEQTKFTYDGDDVLVDDNFGTQTKYLNGSGIDNKLRSTTGSTASYFLADHLGSTNGLTNSSGSLTASTNYDSFGNPTNNTFASRYQFTGREFDNFSGLQYSRARFYDPNLGRFISEDPIGFSGGDVNLYGYVRNRPTVFRDPLGLIPFIPPLMSLENQDLACAIDGYNPWLTAEFGGGLQFGPIGGSDGLVFGINPLTGEFAGQTKMMSGMGGSTGMLATAGFQLGITLGPMQSSTGSSPSAEVFGDAAAFGGGSGSVNFDGGFGVGVGVGPVIGGGAGGGLRIGENTPLFSTNLYPRRKSPCSCKGMQK